MLLPNQMQLFLIQTTKYTLSGREIQSHISPYLRF